MLDFDDKELLEGFEEEFKKKKRNKRSGNRFPSWIIIAIILVAGVFFFLYKKPDTVKVQTNKTPTVELTEGQQSLIQTRQISSSTVLSAEEGKTIETVSTARIKGSSDKLTPTPSISMPSEESEKLTAGTDIALTGSALVQSTETVVHNTTSGQLTIADTAIPVVSAPAIRDSQPAENATGVIKETERSEITAGNTESLKITSTTGVESEKATYNLIFFQKILFFLNPNWVSVPSVTPTVAEPLKITEENPFLNESTSETLVTPEHPEVRGSESPEITEAGNLETGLSGTPIAETVLPKEVNTQEFSQSMTVLPEKERRESVTGTNISVSIENFVEGTPELTRTPAPLMPSSISAQPTAKNADTLVPTHVQADSGRTVATAGSGGYLGGTIVVPVISSNDQSAIENPIVSPQAPSSTMVLVEPSSEVVSKSTPTSVSTPSPVPTVEPTQQPNVFQRFFYFIFPGAKNTETVQTPTNLPTVTSTATIGEVQPAQKPNIFQRFITFIIPGRDEPAPTITSVPAVPPTVTAPAIEPSSLPAPSLSPTAFIPQRDNSSEETQVPTKQVSSDTEPETSEKIPTTDSSLQHTNDSTNYLNKTENVPSGEPETPIQPETGTVIPVQNDSENRIDLNPRLIMFGSTPTAEATEILVVIGKNVGTEVAVTQSTALPKTGVADKWNIPMMILVVMVLLALILGVRLLRNKHSIK